ncbi:hypothetical protein N431DRAFT_545347 [Stipitochalara longipes BDJ]|nr:hypothetical protein N431DRAFT_545347 [Stipitochalara longipes BDJ]
MNSKRKQTTLPSTNILMPLYIYPEPGAWEPLFAAIACHPSLNFFIVINPANGPGINSGPDFNYTREIPRLNACVNVRTVGYISTDYAKRNLNLVLRDIKMYSAWSENSTFPRLGMYGIFLDESSSQYEPASRKYFKTVASAVRSDVGLGSNPLIIHNPGTIPDVRMLSPSICDFSVVFEGAYSTYQLSSIGEQISTLAVSSKCGRDRLACIVHAIPASLSSIEIIAFMNGLRMVVGSLFLTGLSVNYYASFSPRWVEFADELAAA